MAASHPITMPLNNFPFYSFAHPKNHPRSLGWLEYCLFAEELGENLIKFYQTGKTEKGYTSVFHNFSVYKRIEVSLVMANKKPRKSNSTGRSGFKPTDWANVPLDSDDKDNIKHRANDLAALGNDVVVLCEQGFNLFIKFDDGKGHYTSTAIAPHPTDNSRNIGVSAFAPNVALSLTVLLYKVFAVADGDLLGYVSSASGDFG